MFEKNNLKIYNSDCMELMKNYSDNYFDLAIVDPPYGIKRFGNRVDKNAKINTWDIKPSQNYFNELFRISKHTIIWGANNFTLPESEYFLVWDKMQSVENFASAEFAWTNCKKPAKVFRYSIHKTMSDRKSEGGKIHPTQKPIQLYNWILKNYATTDDKILDTHLGSGSSAIASYYYGCKEFIGMEIDEDYYNDSIKRIKQHTAQIKLI
tara:strand:- start:1424 stop:2050 length:627 start_codon:yes stop_codon:yes gene_type:complete